VIEYKKAGKIMNTFKFIGYAGVASIALAISTNSPTLADTTSDHGAVMVKSGNLVHRVSHTLAAAEEYTGNVPSGYKWGEKAQQGQSNKIWNSSEAPAGGYKWGNYHDTVLGMDQSSTPSFSKETRNPWGRRDFSEQARNPWGRRDFSEQARNPWGRRDFSEQARNPWGRR
jgi:hypothetical protein